MARKVYLSAGHTNINGQDQGATAQYNGRTIKEGNLAAEFVTDLHILLVSKGVVVTMDKTENALAQTLAAFRNLFNGKDIAIEYHFNAGGGTGTETIVPDNCSFFEANAARTLSKATGDVLGIKLRNSGIMKEGDTPRKRLGWMRQPCETVLHEVCFLDNQTDMFKYYDNYTALLLSHANAILALTNIP